MPGRFRWQASRRCCSHGPSWDPPLPADAPLFREIGERLHVSQCTVKSQALSAYRKLDVSSRSQAVERAAVLVLIPASPSPMEGEG